MITPIYSVIERGLRSQSGWVAASIPPSRLGSAIRSGRWPRERTPLARRKPHISVPSSEKIAKAAVTNEGEPTRNGEVALSITLKSDPVSLDTVLAVSTMTATQEAGHAREAAEGHDAGN